MIERFNFYDVYGYLLPGSFLLAVAMLPMALSTWSLPHLDVKWAIAFLVAGYFAGHLLQAVARVEFPSTIQRREGPVHPSALVLERDDPTLPRVIKDRLAATIERHFGLDVTDAGQRQAAFELCRQHIQASGSPSYAEQFQGLEAFMRGVQAACSVAVAQYAGWYAGTLLGPDWWETAAVFAALTCGMWVLATFDAAWGRFRIAAITGNAFRALLGLAAGAGLLAGTTNPLAALQRLVILMLAVAMLGAIEIARRSQEDFAKKFASTVYEAFLVRSLMPSHPTSSR